MTESCGLCGRKLITKRSIETGFGPVCYKKHKQAVADAEFEKKQVTIYEVIKEAIA